MQPEQPTVAPDAGTAFAAGVAAEKADQAEQESEQATGTAEVAASIAESAAQTAGEAAERADAAEQTAVVAVDQTRSLDERVAFVESTLAETLTRLNQAGEPKPETGVPAPERAPKPAPKVETEDKPEPRQYGSKTWFGR